MPTADILEAVRERYPDLFVVGFAATHGDPVADAREKLAKKGANLVVGNDISREGVGFGAAENEVYVVGRENERFVPRASKEQVARVILDTMIAEMDEEIEMVERAAGPTTWNAADDQKLRASHLFTSESVTEGHPDKIADQISTPFWTRRSRTTP